jgi:hypothetical protein
MTGPEHYVAAEQILEQADRDLRTYSQDVAANRLAQAQAHATLAVAAALTPRPELKSLPVPPSARGAE